MAPCWSNLPSELLDLIFKHVSNCVDLLQCGAVCVTWRSVVVDMYRRLIPLLPPLLLVPSNGEEAYTIFNISTNKTYKIDIPQVQDRWCCASTNGWLLTIGLNSPDEIRLLNPFSKSQIQLPPRSTFQEPQLDDETYTEGYLKRVITSSSNLYYDPNYIVFVIHCNKHKMAFCKLGDQKWTTLEAPRTTYSDAVFFRGEFYATDGRGNVLHCELSPNPRATRIAPPPIVPFFLGEKYLVESAGEFLMVLRSLEWEESDDEEEITDSNTNTVYRTAHYRTVLLEVFKLDLSKKEWSKVESLGDETLFLGHNQAIAVSTQNSSRCRANCIYFTDSYWEGYFSNIHGCRDTGIYDLGTQSFEQLYDPSQIWRCPFHWITPDLHNI